MDFLYEAEVPERVNIDKDNNQDPLSVDARIVEIDRLIGHKKRVLAALRAERKYVEQEWDRGIQNAEAGIKEQLMMAVMEQFPVVYQPMIDQERVLIEELERLVARRARLMTVLDSESERDGAQSGTQEGPDDDERIARCRRRAVRIGEALLEYKVEHDGLYPDEEPPLWGPFGGKKSRFYDWAGEQVELKRTQTVDVLKKAGCYHGKMQGDSEGLTEMIQAVEQFAHDHVDTAPKSVPKAPKSAPKSPKTET